MNPIIFLDIDGVINTTINKENEKRKGRRSSADVILPKENFAALQYIVVSCDADVVISSNWRLGFSNDTPSKAYINFTNQAAQYGIHPIGWTPYVNRNKAKEINRWLHNYAANYGEYPPYIIIEDHANTVLDLHRGHVISVNSRKGLTMDVADIACRVLRKLKSNTVKASY